MSSWKLFISLALYLTITAKAEFVTHIYDLPNKSSAGSNVITLDFLDDTAFDMRYQTSCETCKCFIDQPTLSYQNRANTSFTDQIIESCIHSGRLYLLHRSDSSAISYSILDVSPPNTLTEVVKEAALPSYQGFENVIFSSASNVFVGYSAGKLILNAVNGQGQVQQSSYVLDPDQNSAQSQAIYDMAYTDGILFIARGEHGMEILTVKEGSSPNLSRTALSIEDLEGDEGFEANQLEIDYTNKVLYVYDSKSGQSSVLVLDFSNKDEISLLESYGLGINGIIQIVATSEQLYVLNQEDERYNYIEFLRSRDDKYEEPDMIKLWQMPEKVNNIQRTDSIMLIDADNYLYVFRRSLPYEAEISELLVDIVHKQSAGDFFPVTQENSTYLVNVGSSKVALLSVQERPEIVLKCGNYKQASYSSTVSFVVDIYRESCDDAPNKGSENVCLDRYKFNIEFSGKKFTEFNADTLTPSPVHLSNWNEVLQNGTTSHVGHGSQNHTNQDNTTNTTNTGGEGLLNPIKKPDLIDPDAPYYDRLDNVYALVIVGLIVLTCFGCLVKCLVDFVRTSKSRISDQFKHQHLEEESDEEYDDAEAQQQSSSQNKRVIAAEEEPEDQDQE